jgi:hypothetical protein
MNQGPIWGWFMKKTRGQKSRATVPLISAQTDATAPLTFTAEPSVLWQLYRLWQNLTLDGHWSDSLHVTVPDRRSRIIPEVVLVRRWAVGVLGIWRGESLGEGWGKRRVSLQATWDWGGRFLSQLGGFQVSKRGYKEEERGNWQGEVKARGMRHV